jgi:hypothetical protein
LLPALVLALLLLAACKTLPPAAQEPPPETAGAEETPPETVNAGETPPETTTPEPPPEFIARAEESVGPLEMPVDGDLIEPVYDLSRPETDDLARTDPPAPEEPAEIALDEAAIKPAPPEPPEPEETAPEAVPEIAASDEAAPEETAVAEAMPEETATEEPLAEEPPEEVAVEEPLPEEAVPEVPPPPPAAASRRTEPPPAPPQTAPSGPAGPVLAARNPPVETEIPAKPDARRTFNVRPGQSFDVPFPETGWIYTGLEDSKNGVNYDSRRVENGSQTFTFRAEKEGDYTLTFYKQDFLRDYYTNEYVNVIVRNDTPVEASAGTPVVAAEGGTPTAGDGEAAAKASTGGIGEDYLRQAREAADAQKYPDAVALLDRFREQNPGMNDEAWWLYGQSFEAASPVRDIKSALDAYSYLTREYPQSRYYRDARNRIAFLNRFYFNIR